MIILYRLISVICFVGGFFLAYYFIFKLEKIFLGVLIMTALFTIGRHFWWKDYETPSSIMSKGKKNPDGN